MTPILITALVKYNLQYRPFEPFRVGYVKDVALCDPDLGPVLVTALVKYNLEYRPFEASRLR